MQGDIQTPPDNIITYLKSLISNAQTPQDFLDINTITVPKTKTDITERMRYNFEKFKGNYIILGAFFAFVFVVFNPLSLPLIAMWVVFFLIFKAKDAVEIKGYSLRRDVVVKGAAVISIIYLLVIYSVVFAMMATISFYVLMVLLHMNFFYEKEEEIDV
ncbi:hypothetical protein COBT_002887 [Conglomerata obtusa]